MGIAITQEFVILINIGFELTKSTFYEFTDSCFGVYKKQEFYQQIDAIIPEARSFYDSPDSGKIQVTEIESRRTVNPKKQCIKNKFKMLTKNCF